MHDRQYVKDTYLNCGPTEACYDFKFITVINATWAVTKESPQCTHTVHGSNTCLSHNYCLSYMSVLYGFIIQTHKMTSSQWAS